VQNITPCLWFNNNAEEAVNFYISILKGAKINTVTHYGDAGAEASRQPKGSVMTITFELMGQEFTALNGGPHFTFSPAISFMISCETQEQIDELWEKLSEGGAKEQCGWLKDKFGVSWQLTVPGFEEMIQGDSETSERVMRAVMQMTKPDIQKIKAAHAGA
jgi:predicted 3-demethylubiquinone-9 3-methyltransferase (glyoxalase superfamily)